MHCPLLDLGWDCYVSIFPNLQHSYGPWLSSEFYFPSISCEQIDEIWLNFVYALTLTRSRLGLLGVNFRKFIT